MTNEALFEAEQTKSQRDHHTPTAGAMTSHIVANLVIHSLKIRQAKWFIKGSATLFIRQYADEWINQEQDFLNQINDILISEQEMVATLTTQFQEYTALTESGAQKYATGEQQLFDLVKDFDTQLLFIVKAIALADKEGKLALSAVLKLLYAWIAQQISLTQRFLNHDIREGLYEEDDDDD